MVGQPRGSTSRHAINTASRSSLRTLPFALTLGLCLTLPAGCGADRFEPHLPPRTQSLDDGSTVHPVVILVMLPAYGEIEQIRRGNMGHVAIDVDGRLYDMGSLNGYAYPFH